ncbi:MAG: tyrosine-type recombinase/integrase [Flexilinea sp.]
MSKFSQRNKLTRDFSVISIDDFYQSFITSKEADNRSPDTIRFYESLLPRFFEWCKSEDINTFGDLDPEAITEYLKTLKLEGRGKGGVHAHFRAIKSHINWIWTMYEPDIPNPIEKVVCSPRRPDPIPGISMQDVSDLLKAADEGYFPERDKAMLYILADTGVRRMELLKITFGDVDLETGEIFIPLGKGGKPRSVFMGYDCRKHLRRYLRIIKDPKPEQSIWFRIDGLPLSIHGATQLLRRLSIRAKLDKPYFFHSFRRCYASELSENGEDINRISHMLGHGSIDVTRRYINVTDKSKIKVQERSSPMDNLRRHKKTFNK